MPVKGEGRLHARGRLSLPILPRAVHARFGRVQTDSEVVTGLRPTVPLIVFEGARLLALRRKARTAQPFAVRQIIRGHAATIATNTPNHSQNTPEMLVWPSAGVRWWSSLKE